MEGFTRSPCPDTLTMCGCWRDLAAIFCDGVAVPQAVPGTLAGSAHRSHAYADGACLHLSLRGDVAMAGRAAWYRAARDAVNAVPIPYNAALSRHHGGSLLRSPHMRDSLGTAFPVLRTAYAARGGTARGGCDIDERPRVVEFDPSA